MSRRGKIIISAVVISLAACMLAGYLAYRWVYNSFLIPPGEGSKAEAGYAASQPVIKALESFHTRENRYPAALNELVPIDLPAIPAEFDSLGIQYSIPKDNSNSYQLEFSYVGPGMNHCTYTPQDGWDCYGFY